MGRWPSKTKTTSSPPSKPAWTSITRRDRAVLPASDSSGAAVSASDRSDEVGSLATTTPGDESLSTTKAAPAAANTTAATLPSITKRHRRRRRPTYVITSCSPSLTDPADSSTSSRRCNRGGSPTLYIHQAPMSGSCPRHDTWPCVLDLYGPRVDLLLATRLGWAHCPGPGMTTSTPSSTKLQNCLIESRVSLRAGS